MTLAPQRPVSVGELQRRYDELTRRHALEIRLSDVTARGGGIAGLVAAAAAQTGNPLWLVDPRRRVVARSGRVRGSQFAPPDLDLLLEQHPIDLATERPLLIPAAPARGIARRHLVMPVARGETLFAWLVVAEVAAGFDQHDVALTSRTAFHLAGEYAAQRRVARSSWNARSALARQLVRGTGHDDDLAQAADYLGVRIDAERVLVYLADVPDLDQADEERLCDLVAHGLGVEVLGTRGRDGAILLIEAPDEVAPLAFVGDVKRVMCDVAARLGDARMILGISGVSRPDQLGRSYREAREVAACVARFGADGVRVVAADDLGPARLFVANSDVEGVRRYARDTLGGLLEDAPGSPDLLGTLQCFFDAGRNVRESAARLAIHENTVRLRLAKIHDLTGLEVASDAHHQLSAQTALLVLRLEGHPSLPPFGADVAVASGPRDVSATIA